MNVAIIAHGAAQDTFDRHLKFWEAINSRPIVYCPTDDPVQTEHERVLSGSRGRATDDSIQRLKLILQQFILSGQEYLVIFEYDSLCLEPEWLQVDDCVLFGNAMLNHDSRFIAPRYLTPPWMLSRSVAIRLMCKANELPFITEHGEVDRWISAVAHLVGVPMLDYQPKGFSCGTIGHEHLSNMHTAIYDGGTMFHGFKHEVILGHALTYWRETKKDTFDRIYASGGWDGQGSGPGSTEEFTRGFREFLVKYIRERQTTQVVDLACGDWQWQRHFSWSAAGVQYVGVDVVSQVVTMLKKDFETDNVAFHLKDALRYAWKMRFEPKPHRLVIVKDLLHHLTERQADRLVRLLEHEEVLWVVDIDDNQVVGPSAKVREKHLQHLPQVFEFERPASYRYGPKVVMAQKR